MSYFVPDSNDLYWMIYHRKYVEAQDNWIKFVGTLTKVVPRKMSTILQDDEVNDLSKHNEFYHLCGGYARDVSSNRFKVGGVNPRTNSCYHCKTPLPDSARMVLTLKALEI